MAPQVLTYTVAVDLGFAPNPFHGWCSLAACTPNHMRARLILGDWIVGHSDVSHGNRLGSSSGSRKSSSLGVMPTQGIWAIGRRKACAHRAFQGDGKLPWRQNGY